MKLYEAYNICDCNTITESSMNELVNYFNRIKNNKMTIEQVLARIKTPVNYGDLKDDKNQKPTFILNGFSENKNNWIKEFTDNFDNAADKQQAEDFFKKVLLAARNRINNVNDDRRNNEKENLKNKTERHAQRMSNIKTNVEFRGYSK